MDVPSIPGYDVLGRIGAGASAQVWRARRVADDLDVALKVVSTGTDQVSSALREAGILARVRHQHVIHLYDVVPVPGVGGRPDGVALAMELAEGGSLAEVLGARDHLTPGELVTVCSPLAGALAELHRAGVVHGDISLGNVIFRSDGMPLLADLGVSRIAGERRDETYGTDGMVAPEVMEGFEPTAESDIYGLGALAWRSLVGEPPGWVGTRPELAELRPELPADLVTLVTSCLSGEPADRPEAEEVSVALYAAARPEPVALAPGADPAAGLTQRIRADLRGGRDVDESQRDATPARRRRVPHPRALLRGSGQRGTAQRGSGRRGFDGRGRGSRRGEGGRPSRKAVGLMVAGAGAVTMIALIVSTWLGSLTGDAPPAASDPAAATADSLAVLGGAEPVATDETGDGSSMITDTASPDPADPTSDQPEVDSAPTPAEGEAAPTLTDSEAAPTPAEGEASPPQEGPAEGPTAVVDPAADPTTSAQQLLDARAAAWRSGDPADLEAVHATGSPAREQETEALTDAQDLDVTYQGLEFTVGEAEVLASGPERAVLEVEVERSAYQEVTPSGEIAHEGRSDVVELELRLSDGDWRIWSWGDAAQAQAGAASGEGGSASTRANIRSQTATSSGSGVSG